ncbi:polymorphic toxin type 28 domain-containing protein [Streptomyces aquilus]|uniref:polymorphic toxin type 28 domain-containing protein n=1 Tax=Streptomyces aquilus TaxID=2548456 RepID=UPI0036C0DEEF
MAGHRPTDWHVLDLEKDPTPGDPDRIKLLAKTLHDFADDVSDALRLVNGMAGEDTLLEWAGKSAEVFKDEFGDVPKNLKKLKKSYDLCGDALADFWPKLERAQALADRALAKGREAQSDLSSANSRLASADSWVTRANKEADKYKDDPTGSKSGGDKPDESKVRAATRDAQHAKSAQSSAQTDVDNAQGALAAAKKMAEDARKMREEAAHTAKSKIDEASDAGIQNRSWWEEVGDWFTDNWDNIVAVCKIVVAVVGVIAMIIGGPILGAIVLIAALVVLADTLYKYSKGQASLWDVGLAALDCIPGMKGLTTLGGLAKGLKGGLAAMKGIKGGLKGMGLAVRGLGKNARTAIADGAKGAYNRLKGKIKGCGDPVDVATGQMFLTETDVSLPGALPFVFTRRVASGHHTGWWFGPSWASTVDQRIEVDEEGLILVTEDGMLVEYPHPEGPNVSVRPEVGPHWPMSRLDDGGYRVDDPASGISRLFAPPRQGIALLKRISDRNHATIDFEYGTDGVPLEIRHSGGYHLTLTVEENRVTALNLAGAAEDDSDLVLKRFGYMDGNLISVTNSSGLPMQFTYDERLRVSSWRDTNGCRYTYGYDDRDRCVVQGGEAGHMANTFAYDVTDSGWPGLRITEVRTAAAALYRYVIDDDCLVVAEIDPLGGVLRTEYDDRHDLVSVTDQLSSTTRLVNNEWGQPVEVIRPDGSALRITYNHLNMATSVELPGGASWQYDYDERGNRIAVVDPAGAVQSLTYTVEGHVETVTDALGSTTRVECDRAGLPIRITDPLGATVSWTRDALGRSVSITDETGHTTELAWSTEGHLVRRTSPDGANEEWTYDGEGNCISHINATGATTRYEYGHFDLLTARTDSNGLRYEYAHDAELRLAQVTNPAGRVWHYTYDRAGRLVSETDFDGRTLTYTHDVAGRLVGKTNGMGQLIQFERDVLGQVIRKVADDQVTMYAYTADGQISQAVGPQARLSRRFNSRGDLTAETVNGRTTTFTYDDLGRRTSRRTPTATASSYSYDAADNPVGLALAGHVISAEHDPAGRELTRRIGESVTVTSAYDVVGRLIRQTARRFEEETVQQRAYSYRADGYLLRLDDHLNGTRHFDLDPSGRVTGVQAVGWTERYAYDGSGNQANAEWPAGHPGHEAAGTREYEGNRLTRAGRVRYAYDPQGRITLRQKARISRKPDTWRYVWDAEDRLTSVITPDGTVWRYLYDPLGRRIAKQRLAEDASTVVEQVDFTWDSSTLCEQTSTTAGSPHHVILTWDYDGLHPRAQSERVTTGDLSQKEVDSRFFAIVTDLVGTPTELLDEQGAVVWRTRSTLWGKTAWTAGSTAYTPLRFPGQYYDPETELHYNYFRYYDPESARYLSADPLGLLPAPNPRTYVHNPHTWTDPLGLAPKCRELGLRDDAQIALAKLENIKKDPVGAINSQPNHNHYNAARREANGEVVATKPDGTPFDHISDLKQARNGLDGIRKILEKEIKNPPETLTERGLEVLIKKHKETTQELDRLNGFLHSIGHR